MSERERIGGCVKKKSRVRGVEKKVRKKREKKKKDGRRQRKGVSRK